MKKYVVASGYFDPLRIGHIEYLRRSKQKGNVLIVIVKNDHQAKLKKGKSFMPTRERVKIIRALECVDIAVESIDEDRTVCKTLKMLHPDIFINRGDQNNDFVTLPRRNLGNTLLYFDPELKSFSIPEAKICKEMGIKMIDGLGDKIQSLPSLLENNLN